MKTALVLLAFVGILGSLAAALFFMMRGNANGEGAGGAAGEDKRRGDRMARALAFRVGFSILLFLCILVAWKMGWIQPTGIPAGA
jgi:hypothetical protein